MMTLLSYPVSGSTPLFPGTPRARFLQEISAEGRKPVSATAQFDTHSGTHIDTPSHYCHGGPTVQEVLQPYNEFFPVLCVDAPAEGTVELEGRHLGPLPPGAGNAQGLLLRTGGHRYRKEDPERFSNDHPYIGASLAWSLLERFPRLELVGIDCVSVAHPDHSEEGTKVHQHLLCRDSPVLILEDMDLSYGPLSQGAFRLIVLPQLHDRLDGTPVAALAVLP